jgi:hypothetical protein
MHQSKPDPDGAKPAHLMHVYQRNFVIKSHPEVKGFISLRPFV